MGRFLMIVSLIAATGALPACGDSGPAPPAMSSVDVPTPEEEAGVRRVFAEYKSAILNKQGDKAANLVSASTLAYFEEVREAALRAPEGEVKKQRLVKKLMILNVRVLASAEDLQKWDAKGLFAFLVQQGLVGSDVRTIEADKTLIRGDQARLGVIASGKVVPPELGFRVVRERGAWRLDVVSIAVDEAPLLRALADVDPDLDTAMVKVVEKSAGRAVGPEVWQPPQK